MNEEAAFLKAIKQNPKDRTARLVFADWLQERDDPRAHWVRNDDIWNWMKPDATPPLPRIIAAVKRRERAPVAALRAMSPAVVSELLAALPDLRDPAVASLQSALQELGAAAEPALPVLLTARKSKAKPIRVGAFRCLIGLAETNAVAREHVLTALNDRDGSVRELAAEALSKSGHAGDAPHLTEVVRRCDPRTFSSALAALRKLGPLDHALIPALVPHVADNDYFVSEAAQDALAKIGRPAIRPLLDAARKNDRTYFNWQVQWTIGRMSGNVIPVLRQAIETGATEATRQLAAETWSWLEMGTHTAASLPWIIEALRGPDSMFRSSAQFAIRRLGPVAAPALPVLLEIAQNTQLDGQHRASAVEVIRHLGRAAEPAIPALLGLLSNPSLSSETARTLDRLGHGPSAVVVLLSLAPRKKSKADDHIANALWIPEPSEDLRDVHNVLREAYRQRGPGDTLTEPARLATEVPPNVPAIRGFLSDTSVATRLVAVFALRHVGTPEAGAGLIAALQDRDKLIRTTAVRALARIGKRVHGLPDALCTATKDRAKDVREAATKALKARKRR